MRSGFAPAEWRVLAGAMAAACLVPLNSTMVAVGLPDIGDDFDIASASAALLVTSYLVAMAVLQPFAGRVGDKLGSRHVAMGALAGFAAASIAAAAAPSFAVLLAARTVQAVFGSAMIPNVQAIVRSAISEERRGRAFGMLGSGIGTGAAIGPVLAGALVELSGWRAMFLASTPVAAVAIALLTRIEAVRRADVSAQAMTAAPLRQLRFVAACVAQSTSNLALYTVLLIVPLILDRRDWSSGTVGLVLTGLTAGMVVLGPVGGSLGDRVGRTRPVVVGMTVVLAGAVVLTVAGATVPAVLVAGVIVVGLGNGLAGASLQAAALEGVPASVSGSAAGVLSTSRYLGSIVGSIAISVLVGASGSGVRTVLAMTAVGAFVAVGAATRIERPSRHAPEPAVPTG